MAMISTIQKPKTKTELLKALQTANVASVEVYEGAGLSRLPAKTELARRKASVIVVTAR